MGSNPRTLPSHAYPIAKRRSYWKWQMRSQVSRNSMCMWIRFCCLYFQIDPYSVENEFMLSLELRYTVRSQIGSPLHGTRPTMCFDAWLTYSGLKQNVGDFYDFLELLNHQARAKAVVLIPIVSVSSPASPEPNTITLMKLCAVCGSTCANFSLTARHARTHTSWTIFFWWHKYPW